MVIIEVNRKYILQFRVSCDFHNFQQDYGGSAEAATMGLDPEGNTMETVLQSAHSTWDRRNIKKGKCKATAQQENPLSFLEPIRKVL